MADIRKVLNVSAPPAAAAGDPSEGPVLHRYRLAYEKALPASQALDVKQLIPINIDVPTAIATTLGKLPGIQALRNRAKALGEFDITVFDELEGHALATGYAHIRYMGASAKPEAILELNERAMRLRNTLYADAVALATRNLISGDRIGEFKATVGYKNLAFDLMALADLIRSNWSTVASKTAITTNDLDEAELLGDQLMSAVGAREQTPSSVADITVQRLRNFTLFVNSYDEVRRAVSFLRWREDDLEQVAPSLYSGRNNSNLRKKGSDTPPATDHAPAPASTAPALPGTVPLPAPAATIPATNTPAINTASAPGLPGSSPFVS